MERKGPMATQKIEIDLPLGFLKVIGLDSNVHDVLRRFNSELSTHFGFKCPEAAFVQPRLARILGCRRLTSEERIDLSAGGNRGRDSRLGMVPIRISSRLVGGLITEPDGESLSDESLEGAHTIAGILGSLAENALLKDALKRTNNRLELRAARENLYGKLNETLGRLALLWESLSTESKLHPDSKEIPQDFQALESLVTQGLMELESAVSSLASSRVRSNGLVIAARDLIDSFERVTGTPARLRVHGTPQNLETEKEEHLFGILFEALSTWELRSRASAVTVSLRFEDEITLTIRDDGVGIGNRDRGGPWPGIHHAMRLIRERAKSIDATTHLESASPRGMVLNARVRNLATTD